MDAELRKQAAELLRTAAATLRGMPKQASQSVVTQGPVINMTKLRSLLNASAK